MILGETFGGDHGLVGGGRLVEEPRHVARALGLPADGLHELGGEFLHGLGGLAGLDDVGARREGEAVLVVVVHAVVHAAGREVLAVEGVHEVLVVERVGARPDIAARMRGVSTSVNRTFPMAERCRHMKQNRQFMMASSNLSICIFNFLP